MPEAHVWLAKCNHYLLPHLFLVRNNCPSWKENLNPTTQSGFQMIPMVLPYLPKPEKLVAFATIQFGNINRDDFHFFNL